MRIEYLFFTIYLAFCFWWIPKTAFLRHADLTTLEARLLLAFKLVTGLVCAFYFDKFSTNVDYLNYNNEGKVQYELLLSHPKTFFTDFTTDFQTYGPGGLLESGNSFWAYLRFNLLFKFIAVLNIISRGNFYLNSAIFCSIVFFGHIAFYRIYSEIYKGNKYKILSICFLLPSLLLYTSCIHKDGIVFVCLGIVSFAFYTLLTNGKSVSAKLILSCLFGITGIFLLRNYVFVALIPAILTAWACKIATTRKKILFVVSYFLFSGLFFLSGYLSVFLNLPASVVKRRVDFALLGEGNTNIAMNELYPTFKSFLINLPQVINHSLLRPYLWEFSNPAVILTAVELFFYQLIIVLFLFFRKKMR